jgi:hypothetical protein
MAPSVTQTLCTNLGISNGLADEFITGEMCDPQKNFLWRETCDCFSEVKWADTSQRLDDNRIQSAFVLDLILRPPSQAHWPDE